MARRRAALAFLLAVASTAPVFVAAVPGVASAGFTFDGVASADGTEILLENPSIPLGVAIQGAGPTTQARLTSLPTSDAFASFPFPGEAIAGAPGIAGGVIGFPVPPYPFIVNSGLGDEPRRQSAPGITLETSSERLSSRSTALIGSVASGIESTASVAVDPDNGVTAVGRTVGRGLEILGSIRLAGVDSHSVASRDSAGTLERSTSLTISRLTIPGLNFTVPPDAPAFAGQTVTGVDIGLTDGQFSIALPFAGAPQNIPVQREAVIGALKSAGIAATYQEPVETPDGIVGAAFTMEFDLPAPPPNGSYDGPTHVTYTLGRSAASVALTPLNDSPTGFGAVPAPAVGDAGAPGAGTDAAGLPGTLPSVDAAAGPAVVPPTVDLVPAGSVPSAGVMPAGLSRRAIDTDHLSDLYLLLAALAGLGFLCARAVRLRGVRLR